MGFFQSSAFLRPCPNPFAFRQNAVAALFIDPPPDMGLPPSPLWANTVVVEGPIAPAPLSCTHVSHPPYDGYEKSSRPEGSPSWRAEHRAATLYSVGPTLGSGP